MVLRKLGRELGIGGKHKEEKQEDEQNTYQAPPTEAPGPVTTSVDTPAMETSTTATEPEAQAPETPTEAVTEPAAQAEESVAAPETYTVQSGDTLSAIAERFYGNADDYTRIFEANRDKLDNPDMIQPGQELTIPR